MCVCVCAVKAAGAGEGDDVEDDDGDADEWRSTGSALPENWRQTTAHTSPALPLHLVP